MTYELLSYQKQAVDFCLKNPRALLRLDTGLGKTFCAISYVKELFERKYVRGRKQEFKVRVLVILPAFLKANWNAEIKKFDADNIWIEWHFISYTKCSQMKYVNSLTRYRYDLIILDESHYVKSWAAKRTKNIIKKVIPCGKRLLLMTATPFTRSAEDLWTQFSVCEPGKWGTLNEFRNKFCQWKPNHYVQSPHAKIWYGAKNTLEIKKRSRSFMFSRKKVDVLHDLPEKMAIDYELEIGEAFHLDSLEYEEYVDENGQLRGGLGSILSKANVELGMEKADYVLKFLESVSETRYVVFCRHKDVAHYISNELRCAVITGETPQEKRATSVQMFQNKARGMDKLVCTIGSCGVGINLYAASVCFFAELPWSYSELKQTEDRLHRIGQTNKVMSYRFIANNTVDELIIKQLNEKYENESKSIGVM